MYWAYPERVPRVSKANRQGIPTELLTLIGLAGALNLMGYEKVYHMKDNFIRRDHTFWSRAMDAKFAGQGNRVDREDFDKLFGGEYMVNSNLLDNLGNRELKY